MAVSSSVGTETRGGRTGQDVVGDTEGGGVRAEEVAIGLTRDDELDDREGESSEIDEHGEDDHEEVGSKENEGTVDLEESSQLRCSGVGDANPHD